MAGREGWERQPALVGLHALSAPHGVCACWAAPGSAVQAGTGGSAIGWALPPAMRVARLHTQLLCILSLVAPLLVHTPCVVSCSALLRPVQVAASEDWESEIDEIVARFQEETGRRVLYTICWY